MNVLIWSRPCDQKRGQAAPPWSLRQVHDLENAGEHPRGWDDLRCAKDLEPVFGLDGGITLRRSLLVELFETLYSSAMRLVSCTATTNIILCRRVGIRRRTA